MAEALRTGKAFQNCRPETTAPLPWGEADVPLVAGAGVGTDAAPELFETVENPDDVGVVEPGVEVSEGVRKKVEEEGIDIGDDDDAEVETRVEEPAELASKLGGGTAAAALTKTPTPQGIAAPVTG